MSVLHNTSEFRERVLMTLKFILEIEEVNVDLKYDDLEVDAGISIRDQDISKYCKDMTFYNRVNIIHKPTGCKINANVNASDLHNVLLLLLGRLDKLVTKYNVQTLLTSTSSNTEEEKKTDTNKSKESKFKFDKWKELLKGIRD